MAPVPTLADPDSLTALRTCVHCGICLPQCPTYRILGEEMDSPRGRLYLMRAVAEGRLPITEQFTHHLDLCLGCRACETACPAGVRFGSLLETARADIERHGRPWRRRWLTRLLFAVFPHPDRLGPLLGLARRYQRWGLQRLVRRTGVLARFPRLAAMDGLLNHVPEQATAPEYLPARGKSRGRVAVLAGCVQRHLFPDVNHDTAHLLSLAGWDVVVPRGQGCCGALELHAGHAEAFQARGRRWRRRCRTTSSGWSPTPPAAARPCATTATGCRARPPRVSAVASAMSPRYWRTRRCRSDRLPLTVAYHDACHLAHGQKVRSEPRALLRRIPGLTLVELRDSDLCCGSAGIYNILEPEMADRLLASKLDRIVQSGARVVATGNPGCLMQIAKGARARGLQLDVVHPVTLLARSAGVRA